MNTNTTSTITMKYINLDGLSTSQIIQKYEEILFKKENILNQLSIQLNESQEKYIEISDKIDLLTSRNKELNENKLKVDKALNQQRTDKDLLFIKLNNLITENDKLKNIISGKKEVKPIQNNNDIKEKNNNFKKNNKENKTLYESLKPEKTKENNNINNKMNLSKKNESPKKKEILNNEKKINITEKINNDNKSEGKKELNDNNKNDIKNEINIKKEKVEEIKINKENNEKNKDENKDDKIEENIFEKKEVKKEEISEKKEEKENNENKNIIKDDKINEIKDSEDNLKKETNNNINKEEDKKEEIIIEEEIDENEIEIINNNNENNNENNINNIDLNLTKANSSQEFRKIKENIKINRINNYLSKDFNYLKSLYKFTFIGIWDQYNKFYKGNMTLDTIILGNKDTFDILIQSKLMSSSEDKRENENLYICCIVKPTHHIKGYMSTEKTSIKFTHCEEDEQSKKLLENDISYDKEQKCCFGSTFKAHIKDSEKVCIEIKYADMRFIVLRTYFYQDTSCEIYTFSNKSYLLNFKDNKELHKFIDNILNHEQFRCVEGNDFKPIKLLGYEKTSDIQSKSISLDKIMEEWQNNNISTLHYIMWLNIFSGRSFNDLTQYPVLPWIITNYKNDKLSTKDYRDLKIPIGMIEISKESQERKQKFIDNYGELKDSLKDDNPDFNYNDFLKKGDKYLND